MHCFKSAYIPAMGIGGDIYDVVSLSEDEVCLFMADVSGHGISAALLTGMLKTQFRSTVLQHAEPDKLLFMMNNAFCNVFGNTDAGVFTCAFCAVFDLKEQKIFFANAGHTLPLYVNSKSGEVSEISSSGVPLGILENNYYLKKSIDFSSGDLFLFHTDGLCDSLYKNDPEEFLIKIKDLLLEIVEKEAQLRPGEILELIISQFVNSEQTGNYECDDISMILTKI